MIPLVVASERGTAQTSGVARRGWGCRDRHCIEMVSGSIWKVTSQKVIIHIHEAKSSIAVS